MIFIRFLGENGTWEVERIPFYKFFIYRRSGLFLGCEIISGWKVKLVCK